jgi:hypothetical protein
MILPIANTLQNTLQNLVSRVAGINNEELADRGIGMAGAMVHSIRSIAYQFKGNEIQNNTNNTSLTGRLFAKDDKSLESPIIPMQTNRIEAKPMKTSPINTIVRDNKIENVKGNDNSNQIGVERKIFNVGKEFINMGMYMSDGKKVRENRKNDIHSINNFERENHRKETNNVNFQETERI